MLSLVAPDEVIDSYLNPWTDDDASWDELTAAVYVVWQMSLHDDLATLALQIAITWAGQGSPRQRTAAALCFCGILGARFPTEAVNRLTQLAHQGEPLAQEEGYALLFATLAEQGSEAAVVLTELRKRLRTETGRPAADRICTAVVDLLSIPDPYSGRPSVALFLIANSLRTAEVGALWARVLCLRPWRADAIKALRDVLGAIERGAANPEDLVRSLGSAIGRDLPPDERIALGTELRAATVRDEAGDASARTAAGPGKSGKRWMSESLVDTFVIACASPPPREMVTSV